MKLTIQTPDGPRQVPEWAICHCVTDHRPNYIHPYPFALPSGDELWLCPNTHHQASTLFKLYQTLDGPPNGMTKAKFNYFARQLVELCWQQIMEMRHEAKTYAEWKAEREQKFTTMTDAEIFDFIRKVESRD